MISENSLNEKYDVFISYGRKDYELEYDQDGKHVKELIPDNPILKIVQILQEEHISCWYDQEGVSANFLKHIKQKIDASRIMIFVSSKHSNASPYTSGEIAHAIQRKMPIIPFKIDKTEYNEDFALLLAPMNMVDTYMAKPEEGLRDLVKCVKKSLEQLKADEEKKEKARLAELQRKKAEQARNELIAALNTDIAKLGQYEAEAIALRQNIHAQISACEEKKLRTDYLDKLNDVGILHQEIEKSKHKLRVTNRRWSLVILLSSILLAASLILLVSRWAFYNHDTHKYEEQKNAIQLLNDSISAVNDSIQIEIENLENQIDLLREEAGKHVANLQVQSKIDLPSAHGSMIIPIKSNVEWKINEVPQKAFYALLKMKNQLKVTYDANHKTTPRSSSFKISTTDGLITKDVQVIQAESTDTFHLYQPISIQHNCERSGKGNGMEIRCPFQLNYVDGECVVVAKFFKADGKTPIDADVREKEYFYSHPTGQPLVSSVPDKFSCQKSGNDHSGYAIFMPYKKLNYMGNMVAKIYITYNSKTRLIGTIPFEYNN